MNSTTFDEMAMNWTVQGNITNTSDTNMNSTTTISAATITGIVGVTIIGTVGVVLNSGILLVVYKAELIKKDYRMIYYVFITVADMAFAVHTVINAATMIFREVAIFKKQWVCMLIQCGGVVAYEGSAMCIILLMVDLIRSIHSPHSWTMRGKKIFAIVACSSTWVIGFSLLAGPILTFYDGKDLEFCSIANVYGSHFYIYHHEAVAYLTVLFVLMALASAILVFEIKRSQLRKQEPVKQGVSQGQLQAKYEDQDQVKGQSETSKSNLDSRSHVPGTCQLKENDSGVASSNDSIATVASKNTNLSYVSVENGQVNSNNGTTGTPNVENEDSQQKEENLSDTFYKNPFKENLSGNTEDDTTPEGRIDLGNKSPVEQDRLQNGDSSNKSKNPSHLQKTGSEEKITKMTGTISAVKNPECPKLKQRQSEQQRKKFIKACKTVSLFMASFVGCCVAYYVDMAIGLTCTTNCDADSQQKRTTRVLCALALYLLPIVNPILYTYRFAVFRKSAMKVYVNAFCPCRRY